MKNFFFNPKEEQNVNEIYYSFSQLCRNYLFFNIF